jgi:hypothetical protein
MHPAMMAAMEGFQRQVDGILTQAQKAKLDSLMAAHHARMEASGHDMSAMHQQMMQGGAAQHDSMHAAHHAGSDAECDDCCREMGCCGDHPAGHTAG